jgi:Tol biopolymer transport system component/predicted Ser/Thr protein kinase
VTSPGTQEDGAARWQRVDDLFHAVLARPAGERAAFLESACANDPALGAEVARLLRAHERAEGFLDGGPVAQLEDAPALEPGRRLGPYVIEGAIARGGMGEVYRARHTRLDRVVAIKVLPREVAASPVQRERLEREARALSALDHPHICAVHDVGHEDGVDFLVMEFLEGETLDARLRRGALPLPLAVRYGVEIAQALDAAHRKGIVHRDLKPSNVMVTRSGARLLDFGIAKRVRRGIAGASGTRTNEPSLTREGSLIGTIGYMAPEQLEGREPDGRSDIFALGAVLHEMVTGRPAFAGTSAARVIAAVLAADPPPLTRGQADLPRELERIVARCLAKDPEERWQNAGDLATALGWLAEAPAGTAASPDERRRRAAGLALAAAAALALVLLAVLLVARPRKAPDAAQPVTASIVPPEGVEFSFDSAHGPPALSPDGRRLAFVGVRADGRQAVWVHELARAAARELAGTDGGAHPFWAPDSRRLGFFADGRLLTIDTGSGGARSVCDAPYPRGGAWTPDDVILFGGLWRPIHRVAVSGGSPEPVTAFEGSEHTHVFPHVLPGGRFLYAAAVFGGNVSTIKVAQLGSAGSRVLTTSAASALYAHPGWILFWRGQALVAQRLDPETMTLQGTAAPVAQPVRALVTTSGSTIASVAGTRALVYQEGASEAHARLTWFDRSGRRLAELGTPGDWMRPSLSPDGRRVVADVVDKARGGSARDLWIFEGERGVPTRFTREPTTERWGAWSPDGRRVAFASSGADTLSVLVQETTGTADAKALFTSAAYHLPAHWSGDGRFLALQTLARELATGWDVSVYSFAEREVRPLLDASYSEGSPQFSPDGRWLAYASDESGRSEIYVQPFPGPGAKTRVSGAGGDQPRWRRDGREIFYREPGGRFMAVPVSARDGTFVAGAPAALFAARTNTSAGIHYDVTGDGQRFIVNVPAAAETASPLTLVLDWPALLQP